MSGGEIMAIELLDVRVPPRPVPTDQLLLRLRHEFEVLPTLRLTVAQAMRLWSLDGATCESALDGLVESGWLKKDGNGRYARVPVSH
jgi:hypothetical protein